MGKEEGLTQLWLPGLDPAAPAAEAGAWFVKPTHSKAVSSHTHSKASRHSHRGDCSVEGFHPFFLRERHCKAPEDGRKTWRTLVAPRFVPGRVWPLTAMAADTAGIAGIGLGIVCFKTPNKL